MFNFLRKVLPCHLLHLATPLYILAGNAQEFQLLQLSKDQPVHRDLNLILNLMDAHKVRDEIRAVWKAKPGGPPPVYAFCSCCPSRGEKRFRESTSLLVREMAPFSVCLNSPLPGFCISHKEFTKV